MSNACPTRKESLKSQSCRSWFENSMSQSVFLWGALWPSRRVFAKNGDYHFIYVTCMGHAQCCCGERAGTGL
eukprot:519136-Amphidinium_carterae.1